MIKLRDWKPALLAVLLIPFTSAQDAPPGFEKVDQEITIKTLKAQMKYDLETVYVAPGSKIKLILENPDDLPHNLVVALPGEKNGEDKGSELANAVLLMGDAMITSGFIPLKHPRLLAHTGLVNPGETKTIYFKVPEKKGNYPLVCTYPGHWSLMNSMMIVGEKPKETGPEGPLTNLRFKAYEGKWNLLPDFSTLTPYKEGELKKIDIAPAEKTQYFGMEFTGDFEAAGAGTYTFTTSSDDGSKLWINDKLVVNNDGLHGVQRKEGKIKLKAGTHKFRVGYFEHGGGEVLSVGYKAPGTAEKPLSVKTAKAAEGNTGLPIIPAWGEASVYRNFIQGAGPRAIGVGFGEAQNYAYNANSMNIPLLWRGAFIDGARHWRGRGVGFQPPSSDEVAQLVITEAPLAYLATPDAKWPEEVEAGEPANRPIGFKFKGYELDKKRIPTFRYLFGEAVITDKVVPNGNGMKRHITITGATQQPEHQLYYSVGTTQALNGAGKSFMLSEQLEVTLPVDGLQRGGQLLIPVTLTDGSAKLELDYSWK